MEPLLDAGTLAPAPNGIICHIFTLTNLAASQSLLQASRGIGVASVQMPFQGSIVGLGYRASEANTAGTATFFVFADGETTGASLVWDTGVTRDVETWAHGTYPFTAGEDVDVRVTTDAFFLPATADLELLLYVTYIPS